MVRSSSGKTIKLYVWGEPVYVTKVVRVPKYVATVSKYVTAVTTKVVTVPFTKYVNARQSQYLSKLKTLSQLSTAEKNAEVSGHQQAINAERETRYQHSNNTSTSSGAWAKYVSEANQAIAVTAALGVALSESTYDSWMGALVAAKRVLEDPSADAKSKAKAALVVELLYPQILQALKQHIVSITKTGAHPGVVAAQWNREHMTEITLGGTKIKVPQGLASDIEKYLSMLKEGKVPGKSVPQQVIYTVEKALNTAAFWPQMLAESLASALEAKAGETANQYEKWFYQALAAATRAGGAAATACWDAILTAMTGGAGLGVIAASAADQFSRMVTDPAEREALKQAFSDPQLFARYVLPVIVGGAIGGAVSVKGLGAASEWVLKNLNAGGKTGALARALFKVGLKNGIFKTVSTFTDPQGTEFKVIAGKNGDLYIVSREWGVLRVDSNMAPEIEKLSVKLGAISKSPAGEEAYLVFKEAMLTHNTKALQLLNQLIDLMNKGGEDTAWVKACLQAIRKNLNNPSRLAAVEAYIRLSKGELKGVTATKFAGLINNQKIAGLIREAYEGGGDTAVYNVVQWLLSSNPDDKAISFITKFYRVTGITPGELSPDDIVTLQHLSPKELSVLESALKEVESLIRRARGSGRTDLTPALQQTLNKYKNILGEEPVRQIIAKYLQSKGVNPNDVLGKVSWGVTVKVIGNGQAWVIDYGVEGPVEVMAKGVSKINESLLSNLSAKGGGFVKVTSTTLSDDAYQSLLAAIKKVAQKHGVHALNTQRLVIPKSWANEILQELKNMGVTAADDLLKRLASSNSKRAALIITSRKATLVMPASDAPVVGDYVIARVIRVKASDVKGLDVKSLVNEMVGEAKEIASKEGIPLDRAFKLAGERAVAKIKQLANKVKDPQLKQQLLANAKLVEELAQKLSSSADLASELGMASVYIDVGADGSVYAAVLVPTAANAAAAAAQSSQQTQHQQSQSQGGGGESLRGNQLLNLIARKFGVSLTQAAAILQQIQSQVKEDITQTLNNLKIIEVPVTIPKPQEVVVEVPKVVEVEEYTVLTDVRPLKPVYVTITVPKPETINQVVTKVIDVEELTELSVNKPLRVVQVPVSIPVPKTIVKEVPKIITVEEYTALSIPGRVVEVEVPKTVVIPVPYYDIIDIPVNMNSKPPKNESTPPQTVPPLSAPPLMPGGINYGKLPPSAFRPPRRKKQEEEVVI